MKHFLLLLALMATILPAYAQDLQTLEKRLSILENQVSAIQSQLKASSAQGTPADNSDAIGTTVSIDGQVVEQDGIKAYVISATGRPDNNFAIEGDYIVTVSVVLENQTDADISFPFSFPEAVDNLGSSLHFVYEGGFGSQPITLYPGVPITLTYIDGVFKTPSVLSIFNIRVLPIDKKNFKPIAFRNIPIKWE